jgi:hypothetical protein
MRKAWLCACAALFLSAAAFADAPSAAPLTREALAAIVGQPLVNGSCPAPAQVGKALLAASGQQKALCSASVTCPPGSTSPSVACSSDTSSTSCASVNRDCSVLEPGHVTCNGVTTSCSPGCCATGTLIQRACCRCDATGGCFDCCRCDGGSLFQCSEACS